MTSKQRDAFIAYRKLVVASRGFYDEAFDAFLAGWRARGQADVNAIDLPDLDDQQHYEAVDAIRALDEEGK